MPLSTHLSSDPEMFQATASPRNLTPSKPVHSSKQKQQRLSKPNPGQIFPSLGRSSTAHGASTNSLNPSSDPVLSLRARANQTNRSPQLAFAAAVVAASLQLFTLPGLTSEHQQNSTQPGSSSNTNIMEEQNKRLDGLLEEVQKVNEVVQKINKSEDKILIIEGLGTFLSLVSTIGVILITIRIDNLQSESKTLNNRLEEVAKSHHETKSIVGKSLMELGDVGKALTEK